MRVRPPKRRSTQSIPLLTLGAWLSANADPIRRSRRCGRRRRICRAAHSPRSMCAWISESRYRSTSTVTATSKACLGGSMPTTGTRAADAGRYFRLLLLGYFEGFDSEGKAWRTSRLSERLQVSQPGAGRDAARSHDGVAHAPADRPGDASGRLRVDSATAGRRRVGARSNDQHRRHHAQGQRGVAHDRASRYQRELRGLSHAVGAGIGHCDSDPRVARPAGPPAPVERVQQRLERSP
jgi:hypothetical protein